MKKAKYLCVLLCLILTKKSTAQEFDRKSLLGKWDKKEGPNYSHRYLNFQNDSTIVASSPMTKNQTVHYELDVSNPDKILLTETMNDPDSLTTIRSYIQINNDELRIQPLTIKGYNTEKERWEESTMPTGTPIVYKRAKK